MQSSERDGIYTSTCEKEYIYIKTAMGERHCLYSTMVEKLDV